MKILIVIDMQNDFLDGSLRNEEAIKIIPNVVEKINLYKQKGDIVLATRDTHFADYLKTEEGRNLPVIHCLEGTYGWEINALVKEALGDSLIFNKHTFASLDLAKYIKDNFAFDAEIELIGVCTDICVISNAMLIKAYLPEAKISVDASCSMGVSIDSHINALNAMKMCQIKIIE